MKKTNCLVLVLILNYLFASGQEKNLDFKDGYALKGKDTIWCKVNFNGKHEHGQRSVALIFNNEEATFYAGGPITGFGVEEDGIKHDYGIVDVEVSVANRRMANLIFVKKIVAGPIDLYEYEYIIGTTKRTTVNGVEKPGSASTTTQRFTNHYISKTDSTLPVLATPVLLPSFRKKDLEVYIGDNAELFARTEKRFGLKEMITIIKEYNNWYLEKKISR